MERETILIAGGGVSGAVLATLLARDGRRAMLVERREAGETKCCGCCLAPRGVRRLTELGLAPVLDYIGAAPTRRWRLRGDAGRILMEQSLGSRAGAVVPRDRFDAALLERARSKGAEIVRGATVQLAPDGEVSIRSRRGEVIERLRPALLVGADGIGSGVARAAGLASEDRAQASVPRLADSRATGRRARLGFSWRIDEPTARTIALEPEVIEIHLVDGGYLGLVHGRGAVHAGALAASGAPSALLRAWAARSEALASLGACEPQSARDFDATGPLPWRPRCIARAAGATGVTGVALIGDAAGYEQPFTGEGMTWAIESAMVLAKVMRTAPRWDERAAAAYAAAHAQVFELRRWRLRTIGRVGEVLSRSRAWQRCAEAVSRVPLIPGAIVRSVVAA